MPEIAVLFGWSRSGTTHIGRCVSLLPDVEYHGEILMNQRHPDQVWYDWLESIKDAKVGMVVAEILAPSIRTWPARELMASAKKHNVRAAWAGRANWQACVESMEHAAKDGNWFYPIKFNPSPNAPLSPLNRLENGLQKAFDKAYPDAPRSLIESYDPLNFIQQWLGKAPAVEPPTMKFRAK